MAKKKRMTIREKEYRAELKKQMQAEGIIPPDKPRLNREKFIEEVITEWDNRDVCYVWDVYLMHAISYMLGHRDRMRMSREAVAAAKILKIAMRLREFSEALKEKGENEYKVTDQYNYIKDILDL